MVTSKGVCYIQAVKTNIILWSYGQVVFNCSFFKNYNYLVLLYTNCLCLGELSILSSLNREDKSQYSIVVRASDGVQNSQTTVIVTVTDVNDEQPVFQKTFYYFDIPESSQTGDDFDAVNYFIFSVSAR